MKFYNAAFAAGLSVSMSFFSFSSVKAQTVVPSAIEGVEVLKPTVNPNYVYIGQVPKPVFNGDLNAYFSIISTSPKDTCESFRLLLTVDSLGTVGNAKVISPCGKEYLPSLQGLLQKMPLWAPARMGGKNISIDVLLNFKIHEGKVTLVEMW